ncbi:MAG: hypothetical protein JWO18_18 [Microbacteriaceae bacterium]|nr:hypothetical protein [Microbacteriaceae bacterium]
MAELQLPKLVVRVRFPSLAPTVGRKAAVCIVQNPRFPTVHVTMLRSGWAMPFQTVTVMYGDTSY